MVRGLRTLEGFLAEFEQHTNFAYTKINHGFWEGIADAYAVYGQPIPADKRRQADRIAGRARFFEGGFVDELLELLTAAGQQTDPNLYFGLELSAWPGDNRILGTPTAPGRSEPVLAPFRRLLGSGTDGLLLKRAVMDGSILTLFDRLRAMRVIIVGPNAVAPLADAAALEDATHLAIDRRDARRSRANTELALRALLDTPSERPRCVLLQAGTLAPYWLLRLRPDYPDVRFIDGGLALSIANPNDLLSRPWGVVYRQELLRTYEQLPGRQGRSPFPRHVRLGYVEEGRKALLAEAEGSAPRSGYPRRVAFVEDKPLDMTRLGTMLLPARVRNHWSNYGPAWSLLRGSYARYLGLPASHTVVPCANGGMALESLAAVHACKQRRPLRWVVSAFGFSNAARGAFANAQVVDTDERGVISLSALAALPNDSYDGFVVTNPYGLVRDFSACAAFAERHGKVMLLDNAAGLGGPGFDHDYQSFSLHHTKAFGFGEGGLAIVPTEEAELALSLLGYGALDPEFTGFWVGNGKLSELACAGHLQRLECAPEWVPLYRMQSLRIQSLAERAGLAPLLPDAGPVVSTSLPFMAPGAVPADALDNPFFVVGKFYRPLAPRPTTTSIYQRLLNIPCHPDMRHVDTDDVLSVLSPLTLARKAA